MNTKTKSNANLYFNKSLFYLKQSNYTSSIAYIDLAINNSSKKSFYMFQKTKVLFSAAKFTECELYIKNHLIHFYNTSSLYIFSQLLSYYIQSTNCSIKSLEKLLNSKDIPSILVDHYIDIITNNPVNFIENAAYCLEDQNFSDSISYSKLALKVDPNNFCAYIYIGKCYSYLEEYDLAVKYYKHANNIKENIPNLQYELGIIMLKLKRYPDAIGYFQFCLTLEPNNPSYIYYLGESFYRWGKYDCALISFKKINPENSLYKDALLRIADIYTHTNNIKKSKRYYRRVIKIK